MMDKDRYDVWHTLPGGERLRLGPIQSENIPGAWIMAGKLAQARRAEIDPESEITIADAATGKIIGTPTKAGQFLLP